MLIIDAHLDLAWNALQWQRDLTQAVHSIRVLESNMTEPGRAMNTVALPEMQRGHVALCFATLLARSSGLHVPHLDYNSPTQAYAICQGQLAWYRAMEREGRMRIISRTSQLHTHWAEWTAWEKSDSDRPPPLGVVISMESADSILDPEQLPEWHEAGLRLIGPAHYGAGRYAGGTGTELDLTAMGKPLLEAMDRLCMGLDVTHLTDKGFDQALSIFQGPVLASHSNCRALTRHQRQLTDSQLHAIFERDGVVGSAFDCWMLETGWIRGVTKNHKVFIDTVVDHIDHVCQLAGNTRHAALGTDLDGGFGLEQGPRDLDTIADLQCIPDLLAKRGYEPDDIVSVMHGNWLRFIKKCLADNAL